MALDNYLFFTESFGWCATNEPPKKWGLGPIVVSATTPRRVGSRYGVTAGSTGYFNNVIGDPQTDFHIHVAYYAPLISGILLSVADIATGSPIYQIEVRVDAQGRLYVTRNGTTIIAATGAPVFPHVGSLEWHSIELLGTIHSSTGWIILQVDGNPYLSATGLNTQNTANANFGRLLIHSLSTNYGFTDVVMRAGSGADDAVDIWGDCKVDYQPVDAAGHYGTWTPNGEATRLKCVDEVAAVIGDTDYNSSSTPAQRDSYTFAAANALADVKGGTIQVAIRKDEVGARTFKLFSRESGTDYDSAAKSLGEIYAVFTHPLPTQGDGSAWDVSDWDAAEAGYEMES